MASKDLQNLTNNPKEKSNRKLPSGKNAGEKATKQSKNWLWKAFRKRAYPSKENELLLSEHKLSANERDKSWRTAEIREANVNLVKFDWDTLGTATEKFSDSNIVGEGSLFGPVYKAVLPTGQAVAVKICSHQSLEEFTKEIVLLQNLQHQNIIRLVGYCIHNEGKLLVYEFMENRSLRDAIERSFELGWAVRFEIIMGIARGLFYLHQASGQRIIHGDLKPSNILLDNDMNPKISGFAFAKYLAEDKCELESRIAGTFAYMSPECYEEGRISFKTDVFCFGIVVLEIVTGRRLQDLTHSMIMILDDDAWNLWENLEGTFSANEAKRCIQVCLLCIQSQPHQRPHMPAVLNMLVGLVQPEEPQDPARPASRQDSARSSDSYGSLEYDDILER